MNQEQLYERAHERVEHLSRGLSYPGPLDRVRRFSQL